MGKLGIVAITGIRNAEFKADHVVNYDHPVYGRGWAAKEAACSDHTKMMLFEPIDFDNPKHIEELRKALDALLAAEMAK